MFNRPTSWRTRASAFTTKTFSNDSKKCGACRETIVEGIGCSNAVAGIHTAFCWKCWAGEDSYSCSTCACEVPDNHVVFCEGCGGIEHAGCTCDMSVIHEDNWHCSFCNTKTSISTAEMEAAVSLHQATHTININNLRNELDISQKERLKMDELYKDNKGKVLALVSDNKTLSKAKKILETKTLELFQKNKQWRHKAADLQIQHTEMAETLSKALKKRKRDANTACLVVSQTLHALEEASKRMRTLVNKK